MSDKTGSTLSTSQLDRAGGSTATEAPSGAGVDPADKSAATEAPEPAEDAPEREAPARAYAVTLADYTVGNLLAGQIVYGPPEAIAAAIGANAVRAASPIEVDLAGHLITPLPEA